MLCLKNTSSPMTARKFLSLNGCDVDMPNCEVSVQSEGTLSNRSKDSYRFKSVQLRYKCSIYKFLRKRNTIIPKKCPLFLRSRLSVCRNTQKTFGTSVSSPTWIMEKLRSPTVSLPQMGSFLPSSQVKYATSILGRTSSSAASQWK